MPRIILSIFLVALVITGLSHPSPAAAPPSPPSISVDADGKVMATPDLARLILEVETQAPYAAAAGQENAKQANALLSAVKPVLGPQDKLRTLGYRLLPVHAYKDKSSPRTSRATRPSISSRLRSWMWPGWGQSSTPPLKTAPPESMDPTGAIPASKNCSARRR